MALLHAPDHRMTVQANDADLAFSPRAQLTVDLTYAYALLWGDDEATVSSICRSGWAVGDVGRLGDKVITGHARVPLLRYCIGSADRCWLWSLQTFMDDPLAAIERVADYYHLHGYRQKGRP